MVVLVVVGELELVDGAVIGERRPHPHWNLATADQLVHSQDVYVGVDRVKRPLGVLAGAAGAIGLVDPVVVEVGLQGPVLGQVRDPGCAPADLPRPAVRIGAPDGQRQAPHHERVQLLVEATGELEVGRRVDGHEDRVVGREVVEARGRGVGVGRGVEDVLLRETDVVVSGGGRGHHPAGDPVQILRDERHLAAALLEHDHAGPQAGVLAADLGVRADPAHHVVAGRRGDVGAGHADPKLGRGAGRWDQREGQGGGREADRELAVAHGLRAPARRPTGSAPPSRSRPPPRRGSPGELDRR